MEINPRDPNHWPFIGSVVDHVDGRHPASESRRPVVACRATSCSPGRSAASASVKWPAPARMAVSWARPTTRSAPSLPARGPQKPRKTLAGKVWEDAGALSRHHAREPVSTERGQQPGPRADARPTRRPPNAARADRAVSPRRPMHRRIGRGSIAIGRWRTTCSARNGCARLSTWGPRPTIRATFTA